MALSTVRAIKPGKKRRLTDCLTVRMSRISFGGRQLLSRNHRCISFWHSAKDYLAPRWVQRKREMAPKVSQNIKIYSLMPWSLYRRTVRFEKAVTVGRCCSWVRLLDDEGSLKRYRYNRPDWPSGLKCLTWPYGWHRCRAPQTIGNRSTPSW